MRCHQAMEVLVFAFSVDKSVSCTVIIRVWAHDPGKSMEARELGSDVTCTKCTQETQANYNTSNNP